MMHPTVDFKNFLKPGVRVHLSGIGGVSICPWAEVLHGPLRAGIGYVGQRYCEAPSFAGHPRCRGPFRR